MKLHKKNEWEYETYLGKDNKRVIFTPGQLVKVEFPDGQTEVLPVVEGRRLGRYSDHGHKSEVYSTTYGVEISFRGIKKFIDLVEMKDVSW